MSTYVDGRSWAEYFKGIRQSVVPASEPADDTEPGPAAITITTPAEEVDSGWPTALGTWRKRALENGWEVKVGHSVAHHGDRYYLNGNLAKAAHEEEQWWLNAVKGTRYVTISYCIVDGKSQSNLTYRGLRGGWKNLSDAEMKEVILSD